MLVEVFVENDNEAYTRGLKFMEDNKSAILGVSPGNTYFNTSTLFELFHYVEKLSFNKIYIMIPKDPYRHTVKAKRVNQGKLLDEERIDRNYRLDCNNLKNKCLSQLGQILNRDKFVLIDWSDQVEKNSLYIEAVNQLSKLMKEDFSNAIYEATESVVGTGPGTKEGTNYILKEIAFLSVASKILNEEKLCFIYHREWKVFEKFLCGFYDGKPKEDLGFLQIKSNS